MKKIILSMLFLASVYYVSSQFNSTKAAPVVEDLGEATVQKILDSRETTIGKSINLSHRLIGLDGAETTFAEYSDQPLVVMFWATWCKACEMQLPQMIEQQALNPNTKFVYIAVRSKDDEILKVNNGFNNQLAIYRKGWEGQESVLSGTTLPLTFVIDKQGTIIAERQGFSMASGVEFITNTLNKSAAVKI